MSQSPDAFLSYTRLDDEFFGGAITSFRRLLELGVQVVTGDHDFEIFQDVEGIEFGQKWAKRLDEAIATSRFLIPVVTPLFFKSGPCRDELTQFLGHEKELGRDDLVLPVYFVTAPVLERPELTREDALAAEIGSRQRFDWRAEADLRPDDPQIRRSVRALAEKIAAAIARTGAAAVPPSAAATGRSVPTAAEVTQLVGTLAQGRDPGKPRRRVLWVDDRPDNNAIERRSMEPYHIDFVLAESTGEALAELRRQPFDAIVSDMSRPPDDRAGYTLLEALRRSGDATPFFIYAGWRAASYAREANARGAQGTTNLGGELLEMLLKALDTQPAPVSRP